jgi:phage terminase large subunit GpA-like protein
METSRIWRAWLETDQRRFHVPCPACGEFQTIEWPRITFGEGSARPTLACSACGTLIEELHKERMLAAGEWRATATAEDPGVVGFHLSALYSPPGWYAWADAVRDFKAAKDHPERLRVWVNTCLGQPWEDREGETLDSAALGGRRGAWDASELPDDVVCLTAGVDVQDDRLEATVVGWCEGQRARVAAHHVLYGSPGEAEVWAALDALLREPLATADGRRVRVVAACVDSGGHHTQAVYRFCDARLGRSVYATKGVPGPKPAWPPRASKSKRHRGMVWPIGVDTIKDWLRGSLAVKDESLPHHVSFAATLDEAYFAQLLVEKRVVRYDRAGKATRQWVKPKAARNEAWDCLVLAASALEAAKTQRRLVLRLPPRATPNPEPIVAPGPDLGRFRAPAAPARRRGFVKNW